MTELKRAMAHAIRLTGAESVSWNEAAVLMRKRIPTGGIANGAVQYFDPTGRATVVGGSEEIMLTISVAKDVIRITGGDNDLQIKAADTLAIAKKSERNHDVTLHFYLQTREGFTFAFQ